MNSLLRQTSTALALAIGIVVLIALPLVVAGPDGRWVSVAVFLAAVFLLALYALVRFVVWAARR